MIREFNVARMLRRHLLQRLVHANGSGCCMTALHKLHRLPGLREDADPALSHLFIVELAAVARVWFLDGCLLVAVQVGHVGGVMRADGGDAFSLRMWVILHGVVS